MQHMLANHFTKRCTVLLVTVAVLVGLTSLGFRLPALSGLSKSGPKPRPRAVLHTQISKCKEQIKQQSLAQQNDETSSAAGLQRLPVLPVPAAVLTGYHVVLEHPRNFSFICLSIPRAPPLCCPA